MHLLLIEGVPGSGKTTTAKEICRRLRRNNIEATWYLEEAADHPIHPRSLTKQSNTPEFGEKCLERWKIFVDQVQNKNEIQIMEGSAFQSTVRFMGTSIN